MEVKKAKKIISAALSSACIFPTPHQALPLPTSDNYLHKVQEYAMPQSTALNIWKDWADNRKVFGQDFPDRAPHLLQMHELMTG